MALSKSSSDRATDQRSTCGSSVFWPWIRSMSSAAGRIIAVARIGPAGVAFLVARREHDDLGAAFRPAPGTPTDVVGKPDFMADTQSR
jgi:hypothetical protein